jgi:putative ABC transport system substrate-binding protein
MRTLAGFADWLMKRREFITLLGGAAAAGWPLAARAQQPERVRRIGVLLPAAADDPAFQARLAAFHQALALLGWSIGRNVRIETRWATTNAAEIRRHAAELAALAPDVILAHGGSTVGPLLQATRTVPIVFPVVGDPVAAGYVDSLARPGGNATGFMLFEFSMGGKWLELLKQIAPGVTRAAVLRDPTQGGGTSQFAVIQAVAPSLRVEISPVNVRDAGEIERAVAAFARSEWRPDRDAEWAGDCSSRSDRHAGGPAQAAGSLQRTLLRRRRRSGFLWG